MSIAFVKLTEEGREFLKNIREEKGLSQYNIKKFDQSTLSDWEIGRYSPTLTNLKMYLRILKINKKFLSNRKFVNHIDYKFKLPKIPKKRKIKIHSSNDLQIILTKKGRQKIRFHRERIGSQKAISILTRIDQGTISKWERGRVNPTLKRFKNYLGLIGLDYHMVIKDKSFIQEIKKPISVRMAEKSADSRRKKILPQKELTEEKAYILGVLGPGDGWVGQDEIELSVTDRDFATAFKKNVELVYGIKSEIKSIKPKNKKYKTKFKVRVSSKMICDDLKSYKVPFKEKIWKVPSEIKKADKKIKIGYVRGVFDSQTHVSIPKKEIRTVILNIPGLYELKSILRDLGIKTTISEKVSKITIFGKENIEKYTNDIGFNIRRKQRALKELLNSYVYK